MASIKKTPSGSFQIRVTHKLLPKTLWATFDSYEQADSYAKPLEGLLAQGIVPVSLLERTTPSRKDRRLAELAVWIGVAYRVAMH